MNQNVFGVILFSVIVGTAIFVSAFFAPVIEQPLVVVEKPTVSSKPTSCFTKKKVVSQPTSVNAENVKVVQSVLNLKTKQLNTQLSWNENLAGKGSPLNLHFFEQTPSGFRFIKTEHIFIPQVFEASDDRTSVVTSSYSWLDSRNAYNNLYVMVETGGRLNSSQENNVVFDSAKATPILLNKGK